MTTQVFHFDKVITEIKRVLAKSPGLEPEDRMKARDALRCFEQLETEYHGDGEDGEDAA